MKKIKYFFLSIAALATIALPTTSNAVFVDLSGIFVDGGSPRVITVVEDEELDLFKSFDIFYSFSVSQSDPSMGLETSISIYSAYLSDSDEGTLEIPGATDCGSGDTSGLFFCSGSLSVLGAAISTGDEWTITLTGSNDNWHDYTFLNGSYIAWGDDVPSSVPEPSTLLLLGAGIAGIGIARKRKSKN
jgi:hypothetical protein